MVALELGRGPPPPPPPRASPRGLTQGFVLITRWQSCRGVLGSSPWLAEKGPEQQPKVLIKCLHQPVCSSHTPVAQNSVVAGTSRSQADYFDSTPVGVALALAESKGCMGRSCSGRGGREGGPVCCRRFTQGRDLPGPFGTPLG